MKYLFAVALAACLTIPVPAAARLKAEPGQLPVSKHQQHFGSSLPCPCGTANVCTGPRGGRYCYTAKGSKRYL